MADEVTPLLSRTPKSIFISSSITKSLQKSCVHSKGALLVLLWCGVLLTAFVTTILLSNQFPTVFTNLSSVTYLIMIAFTLLFPVLGLLGEKWTRYKILMIGSLTMCISCTIMLGIITITDLIGINDTALAILLVITTSPYFFGFILFLANVISFGTDQLQFSPSQELSNLVYWIFGPYYLFSSLIMVLLSMITASVYDKTNIYTTSVLFSSALIVISVAFLAICCFKHHLVIEPAQHNNPVKLIWRVMRYAWKHKQPVRRSAFTYGEPPPSRLDLGKERYGGPFTTEQVEDVKSFCNIISVLFSAYGASLSDFSSKVSDQYLSVLDLQVNKTVTFSEKVVLSFPLTIPFSVYVIYIILFQLIVTPFFTRCIPSMLKCIWFGLVVMLLQLALTTIIALIVNRDIREAFNNQVCLNYFGSYNSTLNDIGMEIFTLPYTVLVVPQFLAGISTALLFITGFEFILAQSPRSMQGLLIGFWLMENNLFNVNNSVFPYSLNCRWQYYAVKSFLVLISVIVYTIAAYKYKYRQRNELSDVNERVIITEYTARQIERVEDKLLNDIDFMVIN